MELEFDGEIIWWRGPAPFHYIRVPDDEAAAIADIAPGVTYGWGVIPVTVLIGASEFTTSLFPKDGGYLVPVKAAIRTAEGLSLGDVVTVRLRIAA